MGRILKWQYKAFRYCKDVSTADYRSTNQRPSSYMSFRLALLATRLLVDLGEHSMLRPLGLHSDGWFGDDYIRPNHRFTEVFIKRPFWGALAYLRCLCKHCLHGTAVSMGTPLERNTVVAAVWRRCHVMATVIPPFLGDNFAGFQRKACYSKLQRYPAVPI